MEYVPAVLPPTPKEEHPHEDWVSAVAGCGGGGSSGGAPLLASACYDGVVRLWAGGECGASFVAHKGPVQAAVAVATRSASPGAGPLLLTAGNDGAARLWVGVAAAARGGAAPEAAALLKGHTDTVQAAAAAPDGNLCATGGWDSRLLLWRCGDALLAAAEAAAGEEGDEAAEAAAAGSKKRRKTANGAAAAAQHVEAPRGELKGHSQCVSGISWAAPGGLGSREGARGVAAQPVHRKIIATFVFHSSTRLPCTSPPAGTLASASWDHSVRLWDVETAAASDTHHHNKAVHCVAAAPGGAGLVAFGGAEKALRVGPPATLLACCRPRPPPAAARRRSRRCRGAAVWLAGWLAAAARPVSHACSLTLCLLLLLAAAPYQVWDPRVRSGEGLAVRSCASHTGWISAVAWHPTSGEGAREEEGTSMPAGTDASPRRCSEGRSEGGRQAQAGPGGRLRAAPCRACLPRSTPPTRALAMLLCSAPRGHRLARRCREALGSTGLHPAPHAGGTHGQGAVRGLGGPLHAGQRRRRLQAARGRGGAGAVAAAAAAATAPTICPCACTGM